MEQAKQGVVADKIFAFYYATRKFDGHNSRGTSDKASLIRNCIIEYLFE
jgi:hypothetical protein